MKTTAQLSTAKTTASSTVETTAKTTAKSIATSNPQTLTTTSSKCTTTTTAKVSSSTLSTIKSSTLSSISQNTVTTASKQSFTTLTTSKGASMVSVPSTSKGTTSTTPSGGISTATTSAVSSHSVVSVSSGVINTIPISVVNSILSNSVIIAPPLPSTAVPGLPSTAPTAATTITPTAATTTSAPASTTLCDNPPPGSICGGPEGYFEPYAAGYIGYETVDSLGDCVAFCESTAYCNSFNYEYDDTLCTTSSGNASTLDFGTEYGGNSNIFDIGCFTCQPYMAPPVTYLCTTDPNVAEDSPGTECGVAADPSDTTDSFFIASYTIDSVEDCDVNCTDTGPCYSFSYDMTDSACILYSTDVADLDVTPDADSTVLFYDDNCYTCTQEPYPGAGET
ncbi:hypothetical protein P7C71_g5277, partial [Lecanoromycetidae sp. Uapishka_2]